MARSEKSGESDRLRDEGITEKAIIRLALRIVIDTDNVGQAWLELQNAMDIAVRVQAEGRITSNHGDFVDTVLARVAELAKGGDYTAAGAEIDAALEQADVAAGWCGGVRKDVARGVELLAGAYVTQQFVIGKLEYFFF